MTNTTKRYEVLFVTTPSLTNDEATTIEHQFRELLSAQKGTTLSYDRWGKYRLAYAIKKNEYGNYFLSRFEIPSENSGKVLEELRNFFAVKYSDSVIRNLFNHLDANSSLEYKRPESMEEAPSRSAYQGRGEEGFERRGRSGKGRKFERSSETASVESEEVDGAANQDFASSEEV